MSEKSSERQGGQSIIIVVGALVVLVMFVAITVDVTDAYYHRRIAQNAADGSALAGAGLLANQIRADSFNDYNIKVRMNDYGERNGIPDTNGVLADFTNGNVEGYYLDWTGQRIVIGGGGDGEDDVFEDEVAYAKVGGGSVPAGAWGVESVTYITAPTWFGGVFGMEGYPLDAVAAVVLGEACGAGCVLPMAVHALTLASPVPEYVPNYDLTDPLTPCINIYDGQGPGNFGWLNWTWQAALSEPEYQDDIVDWGRGGSEPVECKQGACSTQCLRTNLNPDNCNSGAVMVGDWVAGFTGISPENKSLEYLRDYIGHPGVCNDENDYLQGKKCPSASPYITLTVSVYGGGENYLSGSIPEPGTITKTGGLGTGCGAVTGNSGDLSADMTGQFYNVVGFAKIRLLGYRLSEGGTGSMQQHDPWIEPTECITMGLDTTDSGQRLTALFLGLVVEGTSGTCKAVGNQYGLRFFK
jgi:hypothetical protein